MAVTETSGNGYALYNGVKLPNIDSVWTDKVTYPYAMISATAVTPELFGDGAMVYTMILNTTQITNGVKITGIACICTNSQELSDSWFSSGITSNPTYNNWVQMPITEEEVEFNGSEFWTSHDILNEDGTTYLSASEPIPVYEWMR